jgi:hypothetical protein
MSRAFVVGRVRGSHGTKGRERNAPKERSSSRVGAALAARVSFGRCARRVRRWRRSIRTGPVRVRRRSRALRRRPQMGAKKCGARSSHCAAASRELLALKDHWWNDDAHTETLCALATWRSELKEASVDPREELAFRTALRLRTRTPPRRRLRTKTWTLGAQPDEWSQS